MNTNINLKKFITVGSRVPFCYGMTNIKEFYSFEGQAGRPAVLIFAGLLQPSVILSTLVAFQHRSDEFSDLSTDLVVLVDGHSEYVLDYASYQMRGLRIVYCLSEFFQRCGFDHVQPFVFVMDRNQRLVISIDINDHSDVVTSAYACVSTLPTEESRDIALPAPILLVPNIISPSFCRILIEHFENSLYAPGGMASIDSSGNAFHKIDLDKKRRDDYVISPEEPLYEEILNILSQNCLPEMKKAFQFDACHTDRILVARYDDTGGYFRRHRDNVAASVAFRQFAISINLNTDEYDGGYLMFPEYNDHRYRPGRGSGIIFSASLLHEATPVTKGCRYVLLTFFHNAEAQARRFTSG